MEGKSEKTIRRDFDVIKEYFPESFELIRGGKGERGCYKAITKDVFNNFIDKDTIALMVQTFNIAQRNNVLQDLNISMDEKRILESRIKKSKEYPFSIFRLKNIFKIKLHAKTFHINPDIESFIKHMQTPFSKYTPEFRKHLIVAVVEMSK